MKRRKPRPPRDRSQDRIGRIETTTWVPCPGCGTSARLVYVELWGPVPGYPQWMGRHGAPPYAYVLRAAIDHAKDGCPLRERAGRAVLLPRAPLPNAVMPEVARAERQGRRGRRR